MSSPNTLPDPEAIRRTAQEVIQRPEYTLDGGGDAGALWDLLLRLLYWLIKPFQWFFDALDGLPEWLRHLIVIGLVLLLVALITHIIYMFVTALRHKKRKTRLQGTDGDPQPDPESLERSAQQAMERREYIVAIRYLLRACLLRLEQQEQRKFRPGTTNREFLRRFRTRAFVDALTLLVETIDNKWYGSGDCGGEDYKSCHAAYVRIVEQMKGPPHVDIA